MSNQSSFIAAMAKRTVKPIILGLSCLLISACGQMARPESQDATSKATVLDQHSFARPNEARVTHVDLDLKIDFVSKSVEGTAGLTLKTSADAQKVILDTKALDIVSVNDASGNPLRFDLGPNNEMLGRPLTIDLPQGAQKVFVHYKTTKDSEALQWLEPSQTAGKKLPFLFSQGQSIFTRTWIPTQDSPSVRQTYSARLTVPKTMSAVMSADQLTPKGEKIANDPDRLAFRFSMDKPIAPYLIALAVGDIGFSPISDRTGVYAENSMLSKAAYEFVDLENMLKATEKLYGPYRWGRYDVLVLPPSFPFGGMENPKLTFATPTILAGDRSLVSLIAHEMAHSWSGNLVTNATWEDFWLNEGFTTYIENRVMEELYGRDRALMLQSLGHKELTDEVKTFLDDKNGNMTKLHQNLSTIHPDDAFSQVPYEKGANLLRLIESVVGRNRMDAWLKGYFDRHAFKTMTTEGFVNDLQDHLIHHDPILESKIHLKSWLYDEGIPSNIIVPKSDAFKRCGHPNQGLYRRRGPSQLKDPRLFNPRVAIFYPVYARDSDARADG